MEHFFENSKGTLFVYIDFFSMVKSKGLEIFRFNLEDEFVTSTSMSLIVRDQTESSNKQSK